MADKSNIEWTDATWNAIRGCSRCSPGCVHCYAETTGGRFCGPGLPYDGLIRITSSGPHWTGKVSVIEKHLEDPVRWHRPRMIFVNSMSDLFHENLGDMDIALLYAVMLAADWHIYQTLTKRADRKAEWFRKYTPADCYVAAQGERDIHPVGNPFKTATLLRIKDHKGMFPKSWSEVRHIWDGVSMENQEWADKRMANHLSTPLPMHWVSAEPLLGPIDFYDAFWCLPDQQSRRNCLNWVVVGGESGTAARPCEVDWVRAIVKQCQAAGVPVFCKQLGANVLHDGITGPGQHWPTPTSIKRDGLANGMFHRQLTDKKGGEPSEWPEDLRVREYPPSLVATAIQGG